MEFCHCLAILRYYLMLSFIWEISLLYCRFCKNEIFQNFGNIMFSVLCFIIFFSPDNFSPPSLDRFAQIGTNVSSACDLYGVSDFLKSSKTRSQRPKTRKVRQIFRLRRHVFARCDETLKVFLKILFCDGI